MSEHWVIVDSRTGQRASVSGFHSEASAQRQIDEWRARDVRGGRPDCHEQMPYLVPRREW